jgi:hypothetical protein
MAKPAIKTFWANQAIPRISIKDVEDSSKWFKSRIDHEISSVARPARRIGNKRKKVMKPAIGSMYLWHYDAKHAATLPTWDRFPLGFVFKMTGKHFWALNFHYLPVDKRYLLGAALMKAHVRTEGRERDYLKLSWGIIQSAAKAKLFEPCVKQYLYSQMESPFSLIMPDEWALATSLKLEKWANGKPY